MREYGMMLSDRKIARLDGCCVCIEDHPAVRQAEGAVCASCTETIFYPLSPFFLEMYYSSSFEN